MSKGGESSRNNLANHALMGTKPNMEIKNLNKQIEELNMGSSLEPMMNDIRFEQNAHSRIEFRQPNILQGGWNRNFDGSLRQMNPLEANNVGTEQEFGHSSQWINEFNTSTALIPPNAIRPGLAPIYSPGRQLHAPMMLQRQTLQVANMKLQQQDPNSTEWKNEFEKKQDELIDTKSKTEIIAVDQDDLLAKTAGKIAEIMDTGTNEKFKNSNFLKMMKSFRDKELVVEGDKVVEPVSTARMDTDDATVPSPFEMAERFAKTRINWDENSAFEEPPINVSQSLQTPVLNIDPMYSSNVSHDMDDLENFRGFRRKEPIWFEQHEIKQPHLDYDSIIEKDQYEPSEKTADSSDQAVYDQYMDIQNTLESINQKRATHEAIFESPIVTEELAQYHFSPKNPFGTFSALALQSIHTPNNLTESILVKEAILERNPSDAHLIWFELGKLQQENENEIASIAALNKAIELNPEFLDAYLPLAVSYTNENFLGEAYSTIATWLTKNPLYSDIFNKQASSINDRHDLLVSSLLSAAASNPGEQLDPDVQTALGVLFNISSEYEKAIDCFQAALSKTPHDYRLWNRLG